MTFFIGCAVWAYKDWLGDLFPTGSKSGDFLQLYSRRLMAVEGNTTFYATPSPDTVQRWRAETPASFRFCLKLPREVSHGGALVAQREATSAFVERVAPLGERLGPFFLQLPASYGPTRHADLANWLATWPGDQRLAVEVRHPDWYTAPHEQSLMATLDQHDVGRVVMDVRPIRTDVDDGGLLDDARERKPNVPMHPLHSGGMTFVRYIGHPDLDRNAPFLDAWAAQCAAWLRDGVAVYAFMHCPDESRSPTLCRMLQQRLERLANIPPLPWNDLDNPVQTSMF